MFNKEEYKIWLIIQFFSNDTPIDIINAMCVFSDPPYKILKKENSKQATRYIKKYLTKNTDNKPNNVSINIFLLYLYGFKWCSKCSIILSLDNFHILSSRWNKKQSICKSCTSKKDADWYSIEKNKEKQKITRLKWYNNNKSYNIDRVRAWQNENRDKVNVTAAKRRAAKVNATPKWLTKQQLVEIGDIYWCCSEYNRLLEEEYQVDHIIPLQGENVSGLHVPWNLQILLAKDNISKGNRIQER